MYFTLSRRFTFIFILLGCLNSTPTNATEHLTLLLDWFINPDHAPIIIAQEKGFFKEQGLEVELVVPDDPSTPAYSIAKGIGDIAISYQPQLHLYVAHGLAIARIATLIETPLNTLVTLNDGPIDSIKDLKGKKIGSAFNDFENIVLTAMLKSAGLTMNDISLVKTDLNLTDALLAGKVDAIIGAYRNFELNQLDLEGYPGLAFYPEEHGVPLYDQLIFIAHKDLKKRRALTKFLLAIERATLWLTNHPKEALQIFIKAHPKMDTELTYKSWQDTVPRFAKRPSAFSAKRYENYAKFLKNLNIIDEVPPVDDYVKVLQ